MSARIEVFFTPAEQAALSPARLDGAVCVVFDILRATSVMVTALAHGAAGVVPAMDIPEALRLQKEQPAALLAGEREGVRISAAVSGGVEFHLGNSPREFSSDAVLGRRIIATTTNGTRALRACVGAQEILIGSFLNMKAVAEWIIKERPPNLLLVCSGTGVEASYEDTLAAGALASKVWDVYEQGRVSDSAHIARDVYWARERDLVSGMSHAANGRRLLGMPELREDVSFCLSSDKFPILARLEPDGVVRRFA